MEKLLKYMHDRPIATILISWGISITISVLLFIGAVLVIKAVFF